MDSRQAGSTWVRYHHDSVISWLLHKFVLASVIGLLGGMSAGAEAALQQPQNEPAEAQTTSCEQLVVSIEANKNDSALVLELSDQFIALLNESTDPVLEARARIGRSWALQSVGKLDAAGLQAETAIALLKNKNQPSYLGQAHYMLAVARWRRSEGKSALAAAARSKDLQLEAGDLAEIANVLTLMGAIHRSTGDFEKSIECHFGALEIAEEMGDSRAIARSQNNIGLVYWKLDRHEDAFEILSKALAEYRTRDLAHNLAVCLSNVGLILIELERAEKALPYLDEAAQLHLSTGNSRGRAKVLSNQGFAYEQLGDVLASLQYNQQALELRKTIGDKIGTVRSLGCIANLLQMLGDYVIANHMLQEALALAKEINARPEQASLHDLLSISYEKFGEHDLALKHYQIYHKLSQDLMGAETRQQIVRLERQMDLERREREIRELNQLDQLRLAQIEQQQRANRRVIYLCVLLGCCLVGGAVLYISRARALGTAKQSNQQLVKTTKRLAESEERYRMLFECTDVPTVVLDADSHQVLDQNLPARKICGPLPEPSGVALNCIEPAWLRRGLMGLMQVGAGGDYAFDDKFSAPSGLTTWIEYRGSSVSVDGRKALLVSIRDTSAARAQEQARIRADKLESLGQLAGGLAHDFNNALTAISGFIGLAKTTATPQSQAQLAMADQAISQAANLTGQLLIFAKGGEPNLRVLSVAELLPGAVGLANAGSAMHVETDLASDLWNVELDRGQFCQVVSNLVLNAEQACGATGMLEISASNFYGVPVEKSASHFARFVRIDFSDNGPGIPNDIRDHIFDPYYSTKSDGNGLGLTTVYAIVKRHGGEITVSSNVGRGSTFSVFFPATDVPPQSETETDSCADEFEAPGGSVLVLEDETLLQKVYRQLLSNWGYDVEVVDDGVAAIEQYKRRLEENRPFDVIIMDLTIPGGMGGQEAVAAIRQLDPAARAIVASGYSDSPVMARCQDSGFVAALCKPFRGTELSRLLRRVIREDGSSCHTAESVHNDPKPSSEKYPVQ